MAITITREERDILEMALNFLYKSVKRAYQQEQMAGIKELRGSQLTAIEALQRRCSIFEVSK